MLQCEASMAEKNECSPIVTRLAWGEMEIAKIGTGRDYKLFPGGA